MLAGACASGCAFAILSALRAKALAKSTFPKGFSFACLGLLLGVWLQFFVIVSISSPFCFFCVCASLSVFLVFHAFHTQLSSTLCGYFALFCKKSCDYNTTKTKKKKWKNILGFFVFCIVLLCRIVRFYGAQC